MLKKKNSPHRYLRKLFAGIVTAILLLTYQIPNQFVFAAESPQEATVSVSAEKVSAASEESTPPLSETVVPPGLPDADDSVDIPAAESTEAEAPASDEDEQAHIPPPPMEEGSSSKTEPANEAEETVDDTAQPGDQISEETPKEETTELENEVSDVSALTSGVGTADSFGALSKTPRAPASAVKTATLSHGPDITIDITAEVSNKMLVKVSFIIKRNGVVLDNVTSNAFGYFSGSPFSKSAIGFSDYGFEVSVDATTGELKTRFLKEAKQYSITYAPGAHGAFDTAAATEYNSRFSGELMPTAPTPVPDPGWEFDGWKNEITGEKLYAIPERVTGNAEYTAQWRLKPIRTIVYDPGKHGTWDAAKQTYNAYDGEDTPAFKGNTDLDHNAAYVFTGWEPAVSDTVDGNVTYTAQWERLVINFTSGDAKKVYDNTELIKYDHAAANLPPNYEVKFSNQNNKFDAGSIPNSAAFRVYFAGKEVTYLFNQLGTYTANWGTLTVKPRPVTITATDAEKPYDGTPLTSELYTVEEKNGDRGILPIDRVSSLKFTGSQTEVGIGANTPSDAKFGRPMYGTSQDVTKNYAPEYISGKLEVTAADFAIEVTGNSKIYDGTSLVPSGYTVAGLPADYTFELAEGGYSYTGAIVNVSQSGSELGGIDIADGEYTILNDKDEDVTEYFNIPKIIKGALTIEPRSISFTSASDSKPYDGTPLTNGVVDVGGAGFALDEGAIFTVTGAITDPGTADNAFTYEFSEGVFPENYKVTPLDFGTLEVTNSAAVVTITAASDSKVYDGTPLRNARFSSSALPEGVTSVAATVVGSRTAVGSADNEITVYQLRNDDKDVTGYFAPAALINGRLTIVAAPAVTPDPTPVTPAAIPETPAPAPGGVAAVPAAVVGAPVVGAPVVIPDAEPPLASEVNVPTGGTEEISPATIADPEIPQSASGKWALLNLILTILTALVAIGLLAAFIRTRGADGSASARRPFSFLLASILATAAAIVLFVLTEDMSLRMDIADKWTVWHVIVLAVAGVAALAGRRKRAATEEGI